MSCRPKCPTCERLQMDALEIVGGAGAGALSIETLSVRSGLTAEEVGAHYSTAAACAHDVYDGASAELLRVVYSAFDDGVSWEQALGTATQGLLEWLVSNPLEARFYFVEAPRVDRELRWRCQARRQELVDFLAGEYERRCGRERISDVQLELLVGAGFHSVAEALAANDPDQLAALGTRLGELAGVFELAAVA